MLSPKHITCLNKQYQRKLSYYIQFYIKHTVKILQDEKEHIMHKLNMIQQIKVPSHAFEMFQGNECYGYGQAVYSKRMEPHA